MAEKQSKFTAVSKVHVVVHVHHLYYKEFNDMVKDVRASYFDTFLP